jgi:hypothetical protein
MIFDKYPRGGFQGMGKRKRGDRFSGSGVAEFPLTGLYELKKGRWEFSMGNKWMMDFLKKARAKYNQHVNISTIILIPEK